MFFVFDGVDGSGKSTQVALLKDFLRQRAEVVTCKDPGSTALGEALRSILLDKDAVPIDIRTEMMLFSTARTQLIQEVVRPALARGAFVVLDRFVMSTIVYQGHAGMLNPDDIRTVNRFATNGLTPNHTFVFDVPVKIAMQRIGSSQDRMESRGDAYFEAVRKGFLHEQNHSQQTTLIDGTEAVEKIQTQIQTVVEQLLKAQ